MSKLISAKYGELKGDFSTPEFYEKHGFALVEKAVDDKFIDSYEIRWIAENGKKNTFLGWSDDKCYMEIDEIKDVLCSDGINNFFLSIDIGVALHVAKTDWASSFKTWHIDATHQHELGPKNYVGAYVALEDTNPKSGPLSIVSGSHLWNLDYEGVFSVHGMMFEHDELENEITKNNADIITILPSKGDVVVWHGRTVHRGTEAKDSSIPRKGIVAHYCNRLVSEDCVANAGGHVPGEIMLQQFIKNVSGDDDHFFSKWRNGGYYYPDCTITRSWLSHEHAWLGDEIKNISWDELTSKIDVTARGDLSYLSPGYDPEY